MASSLTRKLPTIIGALLLAATLFTAYTATMAQADHMPADKMAAAGSDIDVIGDDGDEEIILQDTMRVSSPTDLILSVTAECSILTSLITGDDEATPVDEDGVPTGEPSMDSGFSFGQLELFVKIDGKRVPVSTDDAGDGEVVFCNRAYQRTVSDSDGGDDESPNGGDDDDSIDQQDDFIRTRTANAFNWLAIDSGNVYDAGGDNILNIEVWARWTESETCGDVRADDDSVPYGKSCADALIGSRTLIVEPTKLSIHEQVTTTEGDTGQGNPNRP